LNKLPVLIFFENKNKLENFAKENQDIKCKEGFHIITEETKDKEHAIKISTQSMRVSLILREYGRGTDFICTDPIVLKQEDGGVAVI
jgi:hypothetical protein